MEITSTATFPADALEVFTMMTDRAFLDEVAKESGATEWDVQTVSNTTTSRRVLPAPPEAQKFVGKTLTVVEKVTWGEAAADGSRTGTLRLDVEGQPVTLTGTIALAPGSGQTVATVAGDLKANIPLVGKKIEKMAQPAVLQGIKVQEKVGNRWLQR